METIELPAVESAAKAKPLRSRTEIASEIPSSPADEAAPPAPVQSGINPTISPPASYPKLAHLFRNSTKAGLSEKQLTELAKAVAEHQQLWDAYSKVTTRRLNQDVRDASSLLFTSPGADAFAALTAAKTAQQAHGDGATAGLLRDAADLFAVQKIVPLVRPAVANRIAAIKAIHERIEKIEIAHADECATPFIESETLRGLRWLELMMKGWIKTWESCPPMPMSIIEALHIQLPT